MGSCGFPSNKQLPSKEKTTAERIKHQSGIKKKKNNNIVPQNLNPQVGSPKPETSWIPTDPQPSHLAPAAQRKSRPGRGRSEPRDRGSARRCGGSAVRRKSKTKQEPLPRKREETRVSPPPQTKKKKKQEHERRKHISTWSVNG